MARDFSRSERVADQIQKDLARLIQMELKDPRLGMVTINEVKVSKDFGYADVYFTSLVTLEGDADSQANEATQVLRSAAGFLRTELARSMRRMRVIPQLRFHYDHSMERGQNLSRLIDDARRLDQDRNDQDVDDDGSSKT